MGVVVGGLDVIVVVVDGRISRGGCVGGPGGGRGGLLFVGGGGSAFWGKEAMRRREGGGGGLEMVAVEDCGWYFGVMRWGLLSWWARCGNVCAWWW